MVSMGPVNSARSTRACLAVAVATITAASAVQYVGKWEVQTADQGAGWASITWLNSNLTDIETNYRTAGMKALYPIQWTVPQKTLCYAPVPHQQTYPNGTFPCVTIDPDYKSKWQSQWQEIKPLVDSGAIIGVFLGDERMYFGIELSEVKMIADEVRLTFPSAIIFLNEAPDITMCNMRKDNTSVFQENECIPINVDWFGMDYYASDSSSWTAPMQTLQSIMGPRFARLGQRFVPTTIGHNFDTQGPVTPQDDAFCVQNGIEWMKQAMGDSRISAVLTFGGKFGPQDNSSCSKLYEGFGKVVQATSPVGTSLDPMAPPPVPNGGQFTEPKCISPLRSAPGIWNWCDRSMDRSWTCEPNTKTCVKSVVGTFATEALCNATCA